MSRESFIDGVRRQADLISAASPVPLSVRELRARVYWSLMDEANDSEFADRFRLDLIPSQQGKYWGLGIPDEAGRLWAKKG